jgi:hypothetical protein
VTACVQRDNSLHLEMAAESVILDQVTQIRRKRSRTYVTVADDYTWKDHSRLRQYGSVTGQCASGTLTLKAPSRHPTCSSGIKAFSVLQCHTVPVYPPK